MYLICTNNKQKEKDVILVLVEHLYEQFLMKDESVDNIHEIIWTDEPTSEFKNKLTVQVLRHLVQKNGKPFTWNFRQPVMLKELCQWKV